MKKRLKKKMLFKHIRSIKKTQLNENDTIIIEINKLMTVKQQQEIHEYVQKIYPNNKILVLQKGDNFKVVTE